MWNSSIRDDMMASYMISGVRRRSGFFLLRESLSNRARAAFAAPMRGIRLIRSMSDGGRGSGLMNGWYLWVI